MSKMTTFASSPMATLTDVPSRYDLAESTCPPLRVAELADPAELGELALDYGTSRGNDELRALLADGTDIAAEQVLVTVGAIEALFLLAQSPAGPATTSWWPRRASRRPGSCPPGWARRSTHFRCPLRTVTGCRWTGSRPR